MLSKEINGVTIEVKQGNIVEQGDVDAIVNAANAQLKMGGGVAGAIHQIGDPELEEETREMAPIETGEAVISSAPHFPNIHIIHVLGPVYGKDKPEGKLLESCYRNALKIADDHKVSSIAFPAISTGAFGYPVKEAAKIAIKTVVKETGSFKKVGLVRFVLFDEDAYQIHAEALEKEA